MTFNTTISAAEEVASLLDLNTKCSRELAQSIIDENFADQEHFIRSCDFFVNRRPILENLLQEQASADNTGEKAEILAAFRLIRA
jgi:hypothetical protein